MTTPTDEKVKAALRYFSNFRMPDGHGDVLAAAYRAAVAEPDPIKRGHCMCCSDFMPKTQAALAAKTEALKVAVDALTLFSEPANMLSGGDMRLFSSQALARIKSLEEK